MLADGSPLQHRPVTAEHQPGASPMNHYDIRSTGGGFADDQLDGSFSSMAVAAENAKAAPPRDSSTCALWCSVALGALVRGCPLAHVRRGCVLSLLLATSRWYPSFGVHVDFIRADPVAGGSLAFSSFINCLCRLDDDVVACISGVNLQSFEW